MSEEKPEYQMIQKDWLYSSTGEVFASGSFYQQPQDGTAYYRTHPESLDAIRAIIREEVHRALYPEEETLDTRPVEYIHDGYGCVTVKYLDEEDSK